MKIKTLLFNTNRSDEKEFAKYWKKFLDYKTMKEQKIPFLNKNGIDRNIIEYIRDSVNRMNEVNKKPAHKEDWQNNVFDPKPRDKTISILSTLASSRMKAEVLVKPKNIFVSAGSEMRRSIYSDMLENSNNHNNDAYELIWEMYTCLSEGIVVGFESWRRDTRNIEFVTEFDPDTGERTTQKVKFDAWDDVYGEIVPFDEWYPETIWTHKNTDVHRCFWVKEMSLDSFKDTYGKYPGANQVKPAAHYYKSPDFTWGISRTISNDHVQVLMYFDEISDIYKIWANGKKIYDGCLPWDHKTIPFWFSVGEPIHHQFMVGKSLPDKMMGMTDINNAVWNGVLDQLFLALNSPIFIDGMSDLDDGYLEPGKIYTIDQGSKVQRAALGMNDPVTLQILTLIQRSIEETSVSAQVQGVSTGGRKTKYEVQQLQEGALNLAGLLLNMMEQTITRKYWLRMHNVIQYHAMPSRDRNGKKKFKFITLENRKLSNGKTGTRKIQIVGSKNELPNVADLRNMNPGDDGQYDSSTSNVEPIVITRDFFLNREFDLDMIIVPNSSVKLSQAAKDARAVAFYQETNQNPMFDQVKNAQDFADAMGKDKSIVKPPAPSPAPGGMDMASILGGGMGQKKVMPNTQPMEDMLPTA